MYVKAAHRHHHKDASKMGADERKFTVRMTQTTRKKSTNGSFQEGRNEAEIPTDSFQICTLNDPWKDGLIGWRTIDIKSLVNRDDRIRTRHKS